MKQGNSKMSEAQVFLSKSAVECFPSVMLSRTYWEWVSKLISLFTCTLLFMPDNLQANRNQRCWGCPNNEANQDSTLPLLSEFSLCFSLYNILFVTLIPHTSVYVLPVFQSQSHQMSVKALQTKSLASSFFSET